MLCAQGLQGGPVVTVDCLTYDLHKCCVRRFCRVAQLSDGSEKEYLPQSFLNFWLDATDDLAATLAPKALDKAVRKFLDSHRKHLLEESEWGRRGAARRSGPPRP